ncbi:MAG: hypothetical protein LC790_16195 [Actinobacteria bacterium]|nr:hypothetical protein [Actinomycetota bacterium]
MIAAELTNSSADFGQLEPMVEAARRELLAAGVNDGLDVVLGDAGYWNTAQIRKIAADGLQVIVAPQSRRRKTTRPGGNTGLMGFMSRVLESPRGNCVVRAPAGLSEREVSVGGTGPGALWENVGWAGRA